MKVFFTLLSLVMGQLVFSQQDTFNVFEIGKGEILKRDYFYLDYFYNDMLIACPLKKGVDYENSDLSGVINLQEKRIIPFKYRNLEKVREGFGKYKGEDPPLLVISNGKARALFRFKNSVFEQITDFEYYKFRPYLFGGAHLSATSGYCEILDLKTGTVLKTKFNDVGPLTDNLIYTQNIYSQLGVINKKGDTILPNLYDRISTISETLICFKKRDSIGVSNELGDLVVLPRFRKIEGAKTRILAQTFNSGEKAGMDDEILQKTGGKAITVKKDEKIKTEINSTDGKIINQNGLFGAFNFDGALKIPFEYSLLQRGIDNELIANKNGKFGVISEDGNAIIDFVYDEIKLLFNSCYLVKSKGDYGLFATNNKKILDVKFKKIFPISKDEILYVLNDFWYKTSYLSQLERWEIQQTKWTSNYSFTYMVTTEDPMVLEDLINKDFFVISDSREYGIVDKDLDLFIPIANPKKPSYFNGKFFDLGKYYTSKGIELEKLDLSSNYICDNMEFKHVIIGQRGGKYGVVNMDGETVVPFTYSYIQSMDGKRFVVRK